MEEKEEAGQGREGCVWSGGRGRKGVERRTGGLRCKEGGTGGYATCAQASGNGHRGVASSSACQPALPEMHRAPRDENATGEKLCGEKLRPFRRAYRYRDFHRSVSSSVISNLLFFCFFFFDWTRMRGSL